MEGFRQAMNAVTTSEAFGKIAAVAFMAGPVIVGLIIGLIHSA